MLGQVSAPPLKKVQKIRNFVSKMCNYQKQNTQGETQLTLLLQLLHCFHFVEVELVVEFVELEAEQLAVEAVELVVGELGSELEL